MSCAERGVLVIVETCMAAAGNFMPQIFEFPKAINYAKSYDTIREYNTT
jgi:hypothetical protein